MRRRHLLIALALCAALAPAWPAAAAAATSSRSQDRLRIAIPGDDGGLTPYSFESGYAFMSLVYDTLTWRDAAGRPQPWLARSIDRDPSGLNVDVRLRSGVHWHDGRPLTADDVVFTYRYIAGRPHPRFTAELQDIRSVQATGPLTIRFALRRRSLGLTDQPFADVPILPRHLWNGLPEGRNAPAGRAVGTGPYRLASYERGEGYRFTANRDYFRGAPSVARLEVPIIRREDSIVDQLRRRRLDAVPITVPPGSTPSRLAGVRFSDEVSYTGTMLLFNVAARPFNRVAARRAVARALDLDVIAGNAAGVDGGTVVADRGMLHPQSRWARAGVLHRFDPGAARLAFAEQGFGGFRVAAPRNDPVRRAAGKRVVRALRALGANARLTELSPRALDDALGRRDKPATFDAAVLGIPALASFDPAFLRVVFGDPRTASLNDGGYRSAEFQRLARAAAAARTERERRGLVNDQLRLLARDLPAVPLLFGGGTIAYRPVAYDRWVGVRGSGILDKRSFLRGAAARSAPAETANELPADITDPSDDQGFTLVPIIIGLAAVLLVGTAVYLWRRRA